jgi:hypothetical protein
MVNHQLGIAKVWSSISDSNCWRYLDRIGGGVGKSELRPTAVMEDDDEYKTHQPPKIPTIVAFWVIDVTRARQKNM